MKRLQTKHLGIIAFIALLAAALVVLFNRNESTLAKRNRDFIPADKMDIDRIVITRNGKSLRLDLSENGTWKVNDEIAARRDRLDLFLAFLDRLEIVSPASKLIRDDVIAHLSEEGRRVQIYMQGRLDKDFMICYDSTGIRGTYMMLTRAKVPYLVRMKGYAGDNLENIFETDRINWQENFFLDLGPDDIREVEVEYPLNSRNSFNLKHNGPDSYLLSGIDGPVPDAQTDIQEMEDYLYFFSNIRFEYPREKYPDSLISSTPFVLLHVVSSNGNAYDLKGYRIQAGGDAAGDMHLSRFMGLIHDGQDTVILDYADLDPIFRRLGDFQKK